MSIAFSDIVSISSLLVSCGALIYSRRKYKIDINPFLSIMHPVRFDNPGKRFELYFVNKGAEFEIINIKPITNNLNVEHPGYLTNLFPKNGSSIGFGYTGKKTASTDNYKLEFVYKGRDFKIHKLIIIGKDGKFIIRRRYFFW